MATVITLALPSAALPEGFALDIPLVELLNQNEDIYVYQLRVGEKSAISTTAFCEEGNHLYLHGIQEVSEPSDWQDQFEITRLPNDSITATFVPKTEDISGNSLPSIASARVGLQQHFLKSPALPCDFLDFVVSNSAEIPLFVVETINGYSSLQQLFGAQP